eukprot:scaffold51686_cov68-Phaeocystis_antarctica.AAC.6
MLVRFGPRGRKLRERHALLADQKAHEHLASAAPRPAPPYRLTYVKNSRPEASVNSPSSTPHQRQTKLRAASLGQLADRFWLAGHRPCFPHSASRFFQPPAVLCTPTSSHTLAVTARGEQRDGLVPGGSATEVGTASTACGGQRVLPNGWTNGAWKPSKAASLQLNGRVSSAAPPLALALTLADVVRAETR